MDKVQNYIRKKAASKPNYCEFIYSGVRVCYKDEFVNEIFLEDSLKKIASIIPKRFLDKVDILYVGNFSFLNKRSINALYEDGTIYLSNEQDDQEDIMDDLIHEIAHAVEDNYGDIIYFDGQLEREFLNKRKRLYEELLAYDENPPKKSLFYNIDYKEELDDYLYEQIGYEKLQHYSAGLFPSTYSITSLREYFAIGFEIYYLEGPQELKQFKELFIKINEVDDAKS